MTEEQKALLARDFTAGILNMSNEEAFDFLVSANYGVAVAISGQKEAAKFLELLMQASCKVAKKLDQETVLTQH